MFSVATCWKIWNLCTIGFIRFFDSILLSFYHNRSSDGTTYFRSFQYMYIIIVNEILKSVLILYINHFFRYKSWVGVSVFIQNHFYRHWLRYTSTLQKGVVPELPVKTKPSKAHRFVVFCCPIPFHNFWLLLSFLHSLLGILSSALKFFLWPLQSIPCITLTVYHKCQYTVFRQGCCFFWFASNMSLQ